MRPSRQRQIFPKWENVTLPGLICVVLSGDGQGGPAADWGQRSYVYALGASTITIFGSDFEVDEVPVSLGDLSALGGALTGTLPSGSSFYSVFYQGGTSCLATTCTGTITLAPEPSSALLLGLGLAGQAAKRRGRAL